MVASYYISQVKRLRETLYSAILFQVCVYLATVFVVTKYDAYSSSKLSYQFHLTFIPSFAWIFYFASYLVQDVDFFETEAVGDLTSRLGADCQQLSNIIGNDINMILRNVLQVISLINHSFLFPSAL